jgi:nickel transport protein
VRRLAILLLLLCANLAAAHEVDPAVAAVDAVSVTLAYADGSPFAYEKYELYAEGQEIPAQVGNTDARGRVTFIPDAAGQWRLKAFSADGHGVDFRFAAPVAPSNAVAANEAGGAGERGPNRPSLMLFGLGAILAIFGIYQLFTKRQKP